MLGRKGTTCWPKPRLPKLDWVWPKAGLDDPKPPLLPPMPKVGWEAGVWKGDGPAAGVPKGELPACPNAPGVPVPAPLHPSCSRGMTLLSAIPSQKMPGTW